jgi:glycosyltransferase involved in cell wall biosynthesis
MNPDLLQISLGTTRGLRIADGWFAKLVCQAGISIETVGVRVGATNRLRRAYPVTDLVEALAARRATTSALTRLEPLALVFSTTTASLLTDDPGVPYAVRLDSPARLNRPGVHNAPLHALERRKLAKAALVLPWSATSAASLPPEAGPVVVVPPPLLVSTDSQPTGPRERLAVAYTPDPKAKGLDLLCRAWTLAAVPGARLEVFGVDRARALRHLRRTGVPEPPNVHWAGSVAPRAFHARLARSVTFVTSARWEDFGMTQLEALALGVLLVCTATEGPFEAGAIARKLNPKLVAADQTPEALASGIEEAFNLDATAADSYRRAAWSRLERYRPRAIVQTIAEQVLPVLLGRRRSGAQLSGR